MLREKLVEKQRESGLKDGEMAAKLGVPRSSYSSIKTGRYRVSLAMVRRIIKEYPDLKDIALDEDEAVEAEAE